MEAKETQSIEGVKTSGIHSAVSLVSAQECPHHSKDRKGASFLLFALPSLLASFFFLLAQVILYSFVQGLGTKIGAVKLILG